MILRQRADGRAGIYVYQPQMRRLGGIRLVVFVRTDLFKTVEPAVEHDRSCLDDIARYRAKLTDARPDGRLIRVIFFVHYVAAFHY